jgi:hypothetical protein
MLQQNEFLVSVSYRRGHGRTRAFRAVSAGRKYDAYQMMLPLFNSTPSVIFTTSSPAVDQRTTVLWHVEAFGRAYRLRTPLVALLSKADGYWFTECEHLSISAFGETEEAVLKEFSEVFVMTWDGLRLESEEGLTEDAKTLRQRFLDLIEMNQNAPYSRHGGNPKHKGVSPR